MRAYGRPCGYPVVPRRAVYGHWRGALSTQQLGHLDAIKPERMIERSASIRVTPVDRYASDKQITG